MSSESAMNSAGKITLMKRGLSLHAVVSLLFFLILSAPHRVHHLFEPLSQPKSLGTDAAVIHDHADNHHQNHPTKQSPASKQTDCAVLAVAQNAHGLAASSFEHLVLALTPTGPHVRAFTLSSSFNPSPCSQRAPPQL